MKPTAVLAAAALRCECKIWDGITNPFSEILQKNTGRSAELDGSLEASRKDSAKDSCVKAKELQLLFEEEFRKAFLSDPNQSNKKNTSDSTTALNERLWKKRFQDLEAICSKKQNQDHFEIDSTLLAAYKKKDVCELVQDQLKELHVSEFSEGTLHSHKKTTKVSVYIHPHFTRPFTAIGPNLFLFCEKSSKLSIFDLARVVHETNHLQQGIRLGWLAFQTSDFFTIERPAMQSEKKFLMGLLKDVSWESSNLRLEWNRGFKDLFESESLGHEEAAKYLLILEEIDGI